MATDIEALLLLPAPYEYDFTFRFEFKVMQIFKDDGHKVNFHTCLRETCSYSDNRSTECYHVVCYDRKPLPITLEFLAATNYDHAPAKGEVKRRVRHIQESLAQHLHRKVAWAGRFPYELCLMIARALDVRDCVTLMAQTEAWRNQHESSVPLDLEGPVYATYIKMDGRYYVKTLRNTRMPRATAERTCIVLPARSENQIVEQSSRHDVFFAEDHLGLRQIFFVSPTRRKDWNRNPPIVPGAWWRLVSKKQRRNSDADLCVKYGPSAIRMISDGFKIRGHETTPREPLEPLEASSSLSWETPVLPSRTTIDLIELMMLSTPRDFLSRVRVRHFDCSAPDIVGYSSAASGVRIHAVLNEEVWDAATASSFDEVSDRHRDCMKNPIEKAGYLDELWRRATDIFEHHLVIGITLSTNEGHTLLFRLDEYYGQLQFRHIFNLDPAEAGLYFNALDPPSSIGDTANNDNDAQNSLPNLFTLVNLIPRPTPPIHPPYTQSNETWTTSWCSMRDVDSVSLWVDYDVPHHPITGFHVIDMEGDRRSVGYYCEAFCLDGFLVEEATDKLRFQLKKTAEGLAFVAGVKCVDAQCEAEDGWNDVALDGALEWAYTSTEVALYHNGVQLEPCEQVSRN
ncbi:hypothetical protein G7046_g4391 [Stylonectria norvegica]|nr:hypothetical protein G7046_g4391 [Stylonectria norvegica]